MSKLGTFILNLPLNPVPNDVNCCQLTAYYKTLNLILTPQLLTNANINTRVEAIGEGALTCLLHQHHDIQLSNACVETLSKVCTLLGRLPPSANATSLYSLMEKKSISPQTYAKLIEYHDDGDVKKSLDLLSSTLVSTKF